MNTDNEIETLDECASEVDILTALIETDYDAVGGKTSPEF